MMPLHHRNRCYQTVLKGDRQAIPYDSLQFMTVGVPVTKDIRFGAAVINKMPQHHPVRVAGNVAPFGHRASAKSGQMAEEPVGTKCPGNEGKRGA